jgi:hypothetical protein
MRKRKNYVILMGPAHFEERDMAWRYNWVKDRQSLAEILWFLSCSAAALFLGYRASISGVLVLADEEMAMEREILAILVMMSLHSRLLGCWESLLET